MIKGIIFDFDGLILDTETPLYRAYNEVFQSYQTELPLEIWQKEVGTSSTFNSLDYLERQINRKVNQEELRKRTQEKIAYRISIEKARPGVHSYLKEARRLNLKIGLASSSSYRWVSEHLKRLNLYHYFHCIKTADDVERVKPDPSLYIEAAKCLGIDVENCLVFEDSANGAKAAKLAEMKCVIVPNDITATMDFCEVEYRLSSMRDIKLRSLIRVLTN